MQEPTNQEDEFETEQGRQEAYRKAVQKLGDRHEASMREIYKHGDQR